jgi:hypothetical protein
MKLLFTLFLFITVAENPISWADTCPLPPSSVDPTVSSSVSYDKRTQLYTYKYQVQNGRDAQIPLKSFILQISQEPPEVASPTHWMSDFLNLSNMPLHLLWNSVPSSKYKPVDISPGAGLSGFSFESPQPPGLTQYDAQGRTGVPSSSTPPVGSPDDETLPNCPDWDFNSPKFKTLVNGITTGPLSPNTVSVSIRLRDESNTHPCGLINPANPSGRVTVLILATKSFDPSQIVISSVQLGPNGATPVSSKLVSARKDDDRVGDRAEWETLARGLGDGRDCDEDTAKKNLLLTFDEAVLGVQCVLDKAVVLTGKTQAGVNIIGGANVSLFGCDIRHPGKHQTVRK